MRIINNTICWSKIGVAAQKNRLVSMGSRLKLYVKKFCYLLVVLYVPYGIYKYIISYDYLHKLPVVNIHEFTSQFGYAIITEEQSCKMILDFNQSIDAVYNTVVEHVSFSTASQGVMSRSLEIKANEESTMSGYNRYKITLTLNPVSNILSIQQHGHGSVNAMYDNREINVSNLIKQAKLFVTHVGEESFELNLSNKNLLVFSLPTHNSSLQMRLIIRNISGTVDPTRDITIHAIALTILVDTFYYQEFNGVRYIKQAKN